MARYVNAVLARVDVRVGRRSTHEGLAAAAERLGADLARAEERIATLEQQLEAVDGCLLRNRGTCDICEGPALFSARNAWFRDHYVCEGCWSIPRERALMRVLTAEVPDWRARSVHESSPSSASSNKLQRECRQYLASHFWPDVPLGSEHQGFRCENLERQTFPDASFDLVVTQDVMEHVLDPAAAFRDIARTLRPGGAHVFTTPIYKDLAATEMRVRLVDGRLEHLAAPEYHGNPIDPEGALVTVHYGQDVCTLVERWSGLATERFAFADVGAGLLGEFLDVMITRKPR